MDIAGLGENWWLGPRGRYEGQDMNEAQEVKWNRISKDYVMFRSE